MFTRTVEKHGTKLKSITEFYLIFKKKRKDIDYNIPYLEKALHCDHNYYLPLLNKVWYKHTIVDGDRSMTLDAAVV